MTKGVLDELVGQRRVADFLKRVLATGQVAHAYLFVGPPGAGKQLAATGLACGIVCKDAGCSVCAACVRVKRGVHPDVHLITPEGAAGYLTEQVREIIRDVSLAPIEGSERVFIIQSADLFNDGSANALLKTLEEPPAGVTFILLAPALDPVPATISSRCQVVRFRRLAPTDANSLLASQTGASLADCAIALAAAGGVIVRARTFLASPARQAARDLVLGGLAGLCEMDNLDVLDTAKGILTAVKAPLDEVREAQVAEVAERTEIFGTTGLKALEERHKRELTAREREGIAEITNITESWLRDCLALAEGLDDLVVNTDAADAMQRTAATFSPVDASRALEAVNEARRRISYNVSPQLAVEAMLFAIREVLTCPR